MECMGNDSTRTQQPRMGLNINIGYAIFNPVPGLRCGVFMAPRVSPMAIQIEDRLASSIYRIATSIFS